MIYAENGTENIQQEKIFLYLQYHTNCQCSAYYIETDDEDDVNDLELEVEEVKTI